MDALAAAAAAGHAAPVPTSQGEEGHTIVRGTPQFGALPPGGRPLERPSAYGIVLDDVGGDLLIVRWRDRGFLPGGGIKKGESARGALRRELLEETGHRAERVEPLCRAAQYLLDADTGRYLNKVCEFFLVDLGVRVRQPAEADHETTWLPAHQAVVTLHEEASSWAVQQALQQRAAE